MWRYRAVLPDVEPVTLGEEWTPMLKSKRFPGLYLKEEGANPTGSFKARGLPVAMARQHLLRRRQRLMTVDCKRFSDVFRPGGDLQYRRGVEAALDLTQSKSTATVV